MEKISITIYGMDDLLDYVSNVETRYYKRLYNNFGFKKSLQLPCIWLKLVLIVSIRLRLTPKSLCPKREAETHVDSIGAAI